MMYEAGEAYMSQAGSAHDRARIEELEREVELLRQIVRTRDDEIVRLTKIVLELRGAQFVAGS